jgi:hypothetical protein
MQSPNPRLTGQSEWHANAVSGKPRHLASPQRISRFTRIPAFATSLSERRHRCETRWGCCRLTRVTIRVDLPPVSWTPRLSYQCLVFAPRLERSRTEVAKLRMSSLPVVEERSLVRCSSGATRLFVRPLAHAKITRARCANACAVCRPARPAFQRLAFVAGEPQRRDGMADRHERSLERTSARTRCSIFFRLTRLEDRNDPSREASQRAGS